MTRTRRALSALPLAALLLAALPVPARAALAPAAASEVAAAIAADPGTVTGAGYQTGPSAPHAAEVSTTALTGFPTDGNSFGVLSSGDASLAAASSQDDTANVGNNGPSRSGTGTDRDVTVLRVDLQVPPGRNCLSVDFRFLSEEFPEWLNSSFNDAFIAELDSTSWTTSGSTITAPGNFAKDPSGEVISINSTGVTGMSAAEAVGTIYDGASPQLRASTPITSGPHSVYLSIFDQGDTALDSAVFLDRLSLGTTTTEGGCQPGAQLPPPIVTKTADSATSAPGSQNGYEITVSNPNDVAVSVDSISDTLPDGFSYVAGSSTGATTEDPTEDGQALTWDGPFNLPASGQISLAFDVVVASEAGEYPNDASATAEGFTIESTGPVAPVTVEGACEPVSVLGATEGGDKLRGTDGADRIQALGGRDYVDALGGADEVCGGDGGDYLYGRAGPDLLFGEGGNDRLYAGDGADVLEGGPGHDALIGGRGPDVILAEDDNVDCIQKQAVDQVQRDSFDIVNPRGGCAPGFWLL